MPKVTKNKKWDEQNIGTYINGAWNLQPFDNFLILFIHSKYVLVLASNSLQKPYEIALASFCSNTCRASELKWLSPATWGYIYCSRLFFSTSSCLVYICFCFIYVFFNIERVHYKRIENEAPAAHNVFTSFFEVQICSTNKKRHKMQ